MANNGNCFESLLIDENGTFNDAEIEHFVKNVDLVNCGLSYAVVSIIGPQSSGKSTLLNHLFGTEFTEMNGELGRTQTTKGIWIARSKGLDPLTLVLDVEGIDGKERGQVSKKLCDPRKTKLLFVVRDLAQTPFVLLDEMLREDIKRIWEDVITDGTPLNDYFIVEVVGLPNYQYKLEDFKNEVEILRQRFFRSISPGGIAGNRNIKGVVPASGFFCHSQQIWKQIKENKDLDLPSIQTMVAIVRCQQIAKEKCDTFAAKKEWCQLDESVKDGTVPGFVKKLNSLIGVCLSEYEVESMGYDEDARSTHRNQLQQNLLQLFKPAFISALENTRSRVQNEFKHSLDNALNRGATFSVAANSCIKSCMSHFDQEFPDIIVIQQAESDKNEVREKLQRDIDAYIISLRATKISKLTSSYQEKLKADLAEPVGYILGEAKSDVWPSIRMLLQDVTKSAISNFLVELSVLDVDGDTRKEIIMSLEACARSVVEGKVRDEARKVFFRMKDRFTMLFSHDSNSRPRVWKGDEDIEGLSRIAYSASLELLSIMSAIRLGNDDFDNIETTLKYALLGTSNGSRSEEFDLLSSKTWKQVSSSRTLITPLQCKELWDQFILETNQIVGSAIEQHNHIKDAKFNRVQKIVGTVATAVVGAVGAVVTAATGGIPLPFLPWFQ